MKNIRNINIEYLRSTDRFDRYHKQSQERNLSNILSRLLQNLKIKTSTCSLRIDNVSEQLEQPLLEENKKKIQALLCRLKTEHETYQKIYLSLQAAKDWINEELKIKRKFNRTLSLNLYNSTNELLHDIIRNIPSFTKISMQALTSLNEMIWEETTITVNNKVKKQKQIKAH